MLVIVGETPARAAAALEQYVGRTVADRASIDLGGVVCRFERWERSRFVRLSAGPRHGLRTSVASLVAFFRRDRGDNAGRYLLILDDLDAAFREWGEEGTNKLLGGLSEFWVSTVVVTTDPRHLVPIRKKPLNFAEIIAVDAAGETVRGPLWQVLQERRTPYVTRLRTAYREALPPLRPLGAAAPVHDETTANEAVGDASRRFANVLVQDMETRETIRGALRPNQYVDVLLNIGPLHPDSVVANSENAPFPADRLPPTPTGWWLDAVLTAPGHQPIRTRAFFLPRTGPSWWCSCNKGGLHYCTEANRTKWVEWAVDVDRSLEAAMWQLAIYIGPTLLQLFLVELAPGKPASASVSWTLDRDFGDPGSFAHRSLSLVPTSHAGVPGLQIKGSQRARVLDFSDSQAATAAEHLRTLLFDAQLSAADGELRCRYDANAAKDFDDFLVDLADLAYAGSELLAALLPDSRDCAEMVTGLRDDGQATGEVQVIQVVKTPGQRMSVPWQLVYDIPGEGDPSGWKVCRSAREFGPGSAWAGLVPVQCPHEDDHEGNPGTLCPFGFWGLSHLLEVPPSSSVRELAITTGDERPPALVVAVNPALANATWDSHIRALADLTERPQLPTEAEEGSWRTTVAAGADVLYFYCHGRRIDRPGSRSFRPTLDLGPRSRLTPQDVTNWPRLSPPLLWETRRPLVVLNACSSGEVMPDTLTEFATAFVAAAGASGVIATEIAMESTLACHAMERFFVALWSGLGVSAALRQMRWEMLARGNLMGLAYTPYCDANLHLPVVNTGH
ncbi:CHAT domain-containing protein [Actinoplanes sp. CA-051413]|uniref:CHAT domain-containing protein n=1 Tax=Actinoplanes sp. CA-051413 TaxID=3239899 RepID=UPI003D966A4B